MNKKQEKITTMDLAAFLVLVGVVIGIVIWVIVLKGGAA
jgi:hypothetical protein